MLLALWPMTTEAPAQALACGGDYVCLPEVLAAGPTSFTDQSRIFAKAVNAAAVQRYPSM
jgi:hypothetical protein